MYQTFFNGETSFLDFDSVSDNTGKWVCSSRWFLYKLQRKYSVDLVYPPSNQRPNLSRHKNMFQFERSCRLEPWRKRYFGEITTKLENTLRLPVSNSDRQRQSFCCFRCSAHGDVTPHLSSISAHSLQLLILIEFVVFFIPLRRSPYCSGHLFMC